jgi:hypothetical protein
MQAARRIYLYLMTGISLGALITGLTMLLAVLLDRLGLGPRGDVVFGGDEAIRQQLTVAAALIAVALPVWLIHWYVVERAARPDRPGGLGELNAPERGLFFALALGILLLVGASGLASAIHDGVMRLVGEPEGYHDIAGGLGRAAVAMTAWGYHARIRSRDWEHRALTHQAAFLPRAYRYAAAFVGLLIALFALTGLVELAGRVLLDVPRDGFGPGAWWAYPLASGVSGVLVGGAVWIGHWAFSTGLLAAPDPRGLSERASRFRPAYFVAVMVSAAATTLFFLAEGIGAALRQALGVDGTMTPTEAIGSIAVPLVNVIPFALGWWLHARWLDDEPIATDTPAGTATADRLRLYPVALVTLAYGAIGAAWLIGLIIDSVLGRGTLGGNELWREQLARFAPYAALGWMAWIWAWSAVQRRSAADPTAESASTTRRTVLLIALALAVLAGIGSAGVILYRLFGSLFGIRLTGDPISELSLPIGILVVAVSVAASHGALVRRDQARRAEFEKENAPESRAPRSIRLRLSGPGDGLERALASLGGATPDGYLLELEPDGPSADTDPGAG